MAFSKAAIFVGVTALVLVVGACGKKDEVAQKHEAGSLSNADPGATVASVNGTIISALDLETEVGRIARRFGGGMPPGGADQMRPQLEQQAMENLVSKLVLYDAVKAAQITAAEAEITSRFEQYKSNFPSDEVFAQQLQQMGYTEENLREEIGMAIQIESLLETNVGEIPTPSVEDCRKYYDSNPAQFEEGEKIQASHILLTVDAAATPEEKESVRIKIASLREQCVAGGDFAELARTNSNCPSSSKGGDLGWFDRGRMVKPFEDAAFSLKPGEISDIVETQFGYHVIRVADHQDGRVIPFDEVQEMIGERIAAESRQENVDAYIKQLREEAEVEYMQG